MVVEFLSVINCFSSGCEDATLAKCLHIQLSEMANRLTGSQVPRVKEERTQLAVCQ